MARWKTFLSAAWAIVIAVLLIPIFQKSMIRVSQVIASVPWRPHLFQALSNLASDFIIVLVALSISVPIWWVGRLALAWIRPGWILERLASFLIGYATVATSLLGLALVGLWYSPLLVAMLVLGSSLAWMRHRKHSTPEISFLPRMPLLALAGLVSVLPWLLAPETHDDAWTYGLAAPERWLHAHRMIATMVDPRQHFPLLAEMVYVYPLIAGLDPVARWLHQLAWLCGACSAVASVGGSPWSWVLVFTTSSSAVFGSSKSDGFTAAFALIAFASAVTPAVRLKARSRAMILSAACGGLSIVSKETAFVNLAWVPVAVLVTQRGEKKSWFFGWCGVALVPLLPWIMKSWILTADPGYPVLSGYFPNLVPGWDVRNGIMWRIQHTNEPFVWYWPGRLFAGLIREQPLAIWALPFLLLVSGRARWITIIALCCYASWFAFAYNVHTSRLAFSALPIVLVVVGNAIPLATRTMRLAAYALGFLAFGLRLLAPFSLADVSPNPFPLLIGAESREVHVARGFTVLNDLRDDLGRIETENCGVLLAGELRTYRLPGRTYLLLPDPGAATPLPWEFARESRTSYELAKKFRQLGIYLVAFNTVRGAAAGLGTYPFVWTDRQLTVYRDYVARYWEHLQAPKRVDFIQGGFDLFRVRARPAEPVSMLICLPGTEGESIQASHLLDHVETLPQAAESARAYAGRIGAVGSAINYAAYASRLAREDEKAYHLYRGPYQAGIISDENLAGFGVVALRTGREREAIEVLEKAQRLYSDRAILLRAYAASAAFLLSFRQLRSDPIAAEQTCRMGLSKLDSGAPTGGQTDPESLLRLSLALALSQQGRTPEALQQMGFAVAKHPELSQTTLIALPELLGRTASALVQLTGLEGFGIVGNRPPERTE